MKGSKPYKYREAEAGLHTNLMCRHTGVPLFVTPPAQYRCLSPAAQQCFTPPPPPLPPCCLIPVSSASGFSLSSTG
jgi:hypothetical protein